MKPPLAIFETLSEWGSISLGFERVQAVLRCLGDPHSRFPHILVGGTNGKGTVCATVAAKLPGRVGLFLSPHIHDIRERITYAGTWIDDQSWQEAHARALRDGGPLIAQLSYFEWLVILATLMFKEGKVDYAVFEVGMGGRDDATNALDPSLSALTNVGLDHQKILGEHLHEIALQKVAIGRPGKPFLIPSVVANYPGVHDFLIQRELSPQVFENKGSFLDNKLLAQLILNNMGVHPDDLSLTPLPGRREIWNYGKGVYLDGAHNEQAWRDLAYWYLSVVGNTRCNLVVTLTQGRAPEKLLKHFAHIADGFYRFEAGYERELPPGSWPAEVTDVHEVPLEKLWERPLLVCGSLYMIDPFKNWMSGWGSPSR